jgi:hypothetical protein
MATKETTQTPNNTVLDNLVQGGWTAEQAQQIIDNKN